MPQLNSSTAAPTDSIWWIRWYLKRTPVTANTFSGNTSYNCCGHETSYYVMSLKLRYNTLSTHGDGLFVITCQIDSDVWEYLKLEKKYAMPPCDDNLLKD